MLSPWFSCWSGHEPVCMEREAGFIHKNTHAQPPFENQLCALPGMYNAHFLLRVLNWQPAGTPHFTTFIKGRAGKCSQALNCWMGSWRHGNTSWPYWRWWQGSHEFQPCQHFIYWEPGGEEPWITTTLSKVYAPFDEKELEIKVESIPNTPSGCCLAERCGLVQVCVLAQPALQWVLRVWIHPCF